MVKIGLKRKLLKSHRVKKLALSKKGLEKVEPIVKSIEKVKQKKNGVEKAIQGKANVKPQAQPINQRSIPTYFEVIRSIEPIYSGGKIQLVNEDLFSSYNFNVIQTSIDSKNIIAHKDEDIANFAVANRGDFIATFTKNYLLRYIQLPTQTLFTQKIEPLFPIDMQFSPEDIFLALGCTSGTVRIINVKKSQTANEYRFHKSSVLKVAWVPIIRKLQLVSAGDDLRIILFDVVTNTCLCQFNNAHENRITSLAFMDNYLLSTSVDQSLKYWDLGMFRLKTNVNLEFDIESVAVVKQKKSQIAVCGTLCGKLILVDTTGNVVKVMELFDQQEILKIMVSSEKIMVITDEMHIYDLNFDFNVEKCVLGYNDEVLDVKFEKGRETPEWILMATNSPYLKLVQMESMEVRLWKAHEEIIMCVEYMDGMIVSGGKDNLIRVWRSVDLKLICEYRGHQGDVVGLSIGGDQLASVSVDGTLKLWDYQSKQQQQQQQLIIIDQSRRSVVAHEKEVNCVRFAPNKRLIGTSSQDRSIKLWDENLMLKMELKGHKRGVWDIQFSPVEKVLASCSGDGTVKVWNLEDGQVVYNYEGHQCGVLKVHWLGLGLALISSDQNGVLKVWNVKKQTCLNSMAHHEGKCWALDVLSGRDGRTYLVSGGSDSLFNLWEDQTDKQNEEKQLKNHETKLKMQSYQNLMREGHYKEAALLAYENNYTKHFIDAMEQVGDVEEISKELSQQDGIKFMNMLNMLNQSNKTCQLAQSLFKFSKLEIVSELVPVLKQFKYTSEKYADRLELHHKNTYLINYTLDKLLLQ